MYELTQFEKRIGSLMGYMDGMDRSMMISPMRTDIVEEEGRFVIKAEAPGFAREDISISVDSGYLTISATKTATGEEEKQNYIRRERRYGSFQRSFDVTGIDTDKIEASYENGVLELILPKTVPVEIPVKTVEIQ